MQIIEVTDLAVRSAIIRLRRRETPLQFVLYPMIHVARPAFYAAVTARLKRADVVVAEGVGGGRVGGRRQRSLLAALAGCTSSAAARTSRSRSSTAPPTYQPSCKDCATATATGPALPTG